jgi:hypothetical protein
MGEYKPHAEGGAPPVARDDPAVHSLGRRDPWQERRDGRATQQGCEMGDPTITVWPQPGSAEVATVASGALNVGDKA